MFKALGEISTYESAESSEESIEIENFNSWKSGASCRLSEIEGFVYGGLTSRFWVARKHIVSLEPEELDHLPFYCWECITL